MKVVPGVVVGNHDSDTWRQRQKIKLFKLHCYLIDCTTADSVGRVCVPHKLVIVVMAAVVAAAAIAAVAVAVVRVMTRISLR